MPTTLDREKAQAATSATVIAANVATHKDDPKLGAWQGRKNAERALDATKARIIYSDGRVETYDDQALAYQIYLALPKGTRAAFRGKDDFDAVYPWSCVDK